MSTVQNDLETIIKGLPFTHCPTCHTRITASTVKVGWNPHAMDDAVFPIAWLTCTYNRCATQLKRAQVNLEGRFAASEKEAMDALQGK
jgi:hypothetical protein